MFDDGELLERFSVDRDEAAFEQLVEAQLKLVYNVALRGVGGDFHLAQDVTQEVFAKLAHKASALCGRRTVSGWLYRCAQYTAIDFARRERRRRKREAEALEMEQDPHLGEEIDWDGLRPLLDKAVSELAEKYRDTVCLRYFRELSYAEIGERLGLSEDGVRSRVKRALAMLEDVLAKRGVRSSAAAIAAGLGGQLSVAAPAGFATVVAKGILAGSAAAGTAGWTFLGIQLMNTSTVAVGAAGLMSVAALVFNYRQSSVLEAARYEVVEARQELASLTERRSAVQADVERLRQERSASDPRLGAGSVDSGLRPVAVEEDEKRPLTPERVNERYEQAKQLHKRDDYAEALTEYLWCFEVGMQRFAQFVGVRRSALLSDLARLAGEYPPAREKMLQLLDQALARATVDPDAREALQDWSAMNEALDRDEDTVALYDRLESDDPRRLVLGPTLYDYFIEEQRYGDILATDNVRQMRGRFEMMKSSESRVRGEGAARALDRRRSYNMKRSATDVEALAGSGNYEDALTLGVALLEYYDSPETRELLSQKLARAGALEVYEAILAALPNGAGPADGNTR